MHRSRWPDALSVGQIDMGGRQELSSKPHENEPPATSHAFPTYPVQLMSFAGFPGPLLPSPQLLSAQAELPECQWLRAPRPKAREHHVQGDPGPVWKLQKPNMTGASRQSRTSEQSTILTARRLRTSLVRNLGPMFAFPPLQGEAAFRLFVWAAKRSTCSPTLRNR